MKNKPLQFLPGRVDKTQQGQVEVLPAIVLPDGSEILLHGFDRACGPRQHKRRKKNLPTLADRNELGQKLVDSINGHGAKPAKARRFWVNPLDLKWSGTSLLRCFSQINTGETQSAITPVLVVRDTPAARQALGFNQT